MTVLFKKYTYGLLLATTTLISFCSAYDFQYNGTYRASSFPSYATTINDFPVFPSSDNYVINFDCTFSNISYDTVNNSSFPNFLFRLYYFDGSSRNVSSSSFSILNGNITGSINVSSSVNFYQRLSFLKDQGAVSSSVSFDYLCIFSYNVNLSCDYSDYELKTDITESYCTNKFNTLIPVSAVDSSYCSNNGLCPYDCPEGTGDVQRSALYINEIQHQGNENINITIPEEIERDYSNVDDTVDIEITGYGYDQNKMQQLVNTQYYTPTSEDMATLVGKIANFLPLLAIMLLIVRTWYLIKKVF